MPNPDATPTSTATALADLNVWAACRSDRRRILVILDTLNINSSPNFSSIRLGPLLLAKGRSVYQRSVRRCGESSTECLIFVNSRRSALERMLADHSFPAMRRIAVGPSFASSIAK
jgi:hypothetical protein